MQGPKLHLHINVLELLMEYFALKHFSLRLTGHHVLIRTDNMATVDNINRQEGLQLAQMWLSQMIWHWFGTAQADIFASDRNIHYPLWF